MLRSTFAAVAGLALIPGLAFANVLVVAPTGAPFANIQSAINAAADGDTILVKPGDYAGFNVGAKSLSIVADVEGSVLLTSQTWINDVPAGKRVSVSGMRYWSGGLTCLQCAGSIRLEAMSSQAYPGPVLPGSGLRIQNCSDVAVLRCSLRGKSWMGSGIRVMHSTVAVYDSRATGGRGLDGQWDGTPGGSQAAIPGAPGVSVEDSSLFFASAGTFLGGDGGTGTPGICVPYTMNGGWGANGGPGLAVEAGSTAHVLDSTLTGGAAGQGGPGGTPCGTPPGSQGLAGPASAGIVNALAGHSAVLRCATHLRESNSLALRFEGVPGELVWLRLSATPQWVLAVPLLGVQLAGSPARRVLLGTIPTTGILNTSIFLGPLAPGVESTTLHMQAYFVDAAGNTRCGSAAVVVVLDAAF